MPPFRLAREVNVARRVSGDAGIFAFCALSPRGDGAVGDSSVHRNVRLRDQINN